MGAFSLTEFQRLLQTVTNSVADAPLDQNLEDMLNQRFPPSSQLFQDIQRACLAGLESGDLCARKAGGIAYGRVIKPAPELGGASVDVVHMNNVVGPHHRHPLGEIDLIMPLTANAKFDGQGAGWKVYGPDSAHNPTVTDGEALVLYLLPNGEIEFTRQQQ